MLHQSRTRSSLINIGTNFDDRSTRSKLIFANCHSNPKDRIQKNVRPIRRFSHRCSFAIKVRCRTVRQAARSRQGNTVRQGYIGKPARTFQAAKHRGAWKFPATISFASKTVGFTLIAQGSNSRSGSWLSYLIHANFDEMIRCGMLVVASSDLIWSQHDRLIRQLTH